jgi:hypothetical protein
MQSRVETNALCLCDLLGIDGDMLSYYQLFQVIGAILNDPIIEKLIRENIHALIVPWPGYEKEGYKCLDPNARTGFIKAMNSAERAALRQRVAAKVHQFPAGAFLEK